MTIILPPAVKYTGAAAGSTDAALVVTVSPNSAGGGPVCVVGPPIAANPYPQPVQTLEQQNGFTGNDCVVDCLNNIARELRLLNIKMSELPVWLAKNLNTPSPSYIPSTDDDRAFRDDPSNFMN